MNKEVSMRLELKEGDARENGKGGKGGLRIG
jgi:hypothetical protein